MRFSHMRLKKKRTYLTKLLVVAERQKKTKDRDN